MQTALGSWIDGSAKESILKFVGRVTQPGPDFVPVEERIAVFDNDGTLWCEKPLPVQADFLLRRVGEMVERNPALGSEQPWEAVIDKDYAWFGEVITKHYHGDDSDLRVMSRGLLEAYAGASIEEFEAAASKFLRTALHPTLGRPYASCTYQPMLELLDLLRQNGFSIYVASGGGRDFMRAAAPELYDLTPDRVIGSSVALAFRDDGTRADLVHEAKIDVFDDGPAKPVQIWSRIGRRPILAAGNSNGDVPMLRFAASHARPSLELLVKHDAEREFVYVAGAEEALRRAESEAWTIVSMKDDWRSIFPESSGKAGSAA